MGLICDPHPTRKRVGLSHLPEGEAKNIFRLELAELVCLVRFRVANFRFTFIHSSISNDLYSMGFEIPSPLTLQKIPSGLQ